MGTNLNSTHLYQEAPFLGEKKKKKAMYLMKCWKIHIIVMWTP